VNRGHGLDPQRQRGGALADHGTGALGLEAAAHAHRDPRLGRGYDRPRVQHPGAEIRHLGCLAIRHARQRARLLHQSGVSAQNAVHIGVDDDLLGLQRGANQGRRIIRSAAAEGRRYSLGRRGDESGDDRNDAGIEHRSQLAADALTSRLALDDRRLVALVGDDQRASIDVARLASRLPQRTSEEGRAETLAKRHEQGPGARRLLAQQPDALEERGQLVESLAQLLQHRCVAFRRSEVPLLERLDDRGGCLAFSALGEPPGFEQPVSRVTHRRDDDGCWSVFSAGDRGGSRQRLWIGEGCAPEFQHQHLQCPLAGVIAGGRRGGSHASPFRTTGPSTTKARIPAIRALRRLCHGPDGLRGPAR
jgi:hypothetical protein